MDGSMDRDFQWKARKPLAAGRRNKCLAITYTPPCQPKIFTELGENLPDLGGQYRRGHRIPLLSRTPGGCRVHGSAPYVRN